MHLCFAAAAILYIYGIGCGPRDRYRAPYKGGFVNIQADKFVITSPFPPHKWYKDDDRYDRYTQLERRITQVIEYKVGLVQPFDYSTQFPEDIF